MGVPSLELGKTALRKFLVVEANRPPSKIFVELLSFFVAQIGARNRNRDKFISLSPVICELVHDICRAPSRGLAMAGTQRGALLLLEMKGVVTRDSIGGHQGMSPSFGAGGVASRGGARACIANGPHT